MWFTETAWPPAIVLLTLAAAMLIPWSQSRRAVWLGIAVVCLLAVPVVFVIERTIVTPAEEVELAVHSLRDAVAADDADAVLEYFSANAPIERLKVRGAMAVGRLLPDSRITDLTVTTSAGDTLAESVFRANGTVQAKAIDATSHLASRWRLAWRQEEGDWKIYAVERLNPITGEPIDLLSRD